MSADPWDIKPLKYTPEDLGFVETRKAVLNELCGSLGIPPLKVAWAAFQQATVAAEYLAAMLSQYQPPVFWERVLLRGGYFDGVEPKVLPTEDWVSISIASAIMPPRIYKRTAEREHGMIVFRYLEPERN